jgi:CopG family nickel-responsive transcriptional regulator
MEELDAVIAEHGYQNRSEAIRDFTRAGMQQAAHAKGNTGECVAALVYVYDHAARDLSRRLVENYHGHHDLALATLHVHLDDDHCMEVTALRGAGAEIQHFADHIIAERGVKWTRGDNPQGRGQEYNSSAQAEPPEFVSSKATMRFFQRNTGCG